jgi:hypothetical protein
LQVLEVRSGNASVGKAYDVYFGEWDREMVYPLTPDQLARDYIAAMYFDPADGKTGSSDFQSTVRPIGTGWPSDRNTGARSSRIKIN